MFLATVFLMGMVVGALLAKCCGRAMVIEVRTSGSQTEVDAASTSAQTEDRALGVRWIPPKAVVVAPRRGGKFHIMGCPQLRQAREIGSYTPCRTCLSPWDRACGPE